MEQLPRRIEYRLVDVFSDEPFSGNGVAVFAESVGFTTEMMQRITQELRQFESIFLQPLPESEIIVARIFTMEEELGFAGHPVLGAAGVLHELNPAKGEHAVWQLGLKSKVITVTTTRRDHALTATMDQGTPVFGQIASQDDVLAVLHALHLEIDDLDQDLPMQMVSTGLPYLIVPLKQGLDRAQIIHPQFEDLLTGLGAKFVYVVDIASHEARNWDNAGRVEDIATGSAAGPLAAYLVRYGKAFPETDITLQQGRFVGRPSRIKARVAGTAENISSVYVSGAVAPVGSGVLDTLPRVEDVTHY